MDYYYILENVGSSDKADLSLGTRIFLVPENVVFPVPGQVFVFDDGEGPYESLKQLREHSESYQRLLLQNPRRAARIFEKKFIIPINLAESAYYIAHEDDEFHKQVYNLLNHTLNGIVKRSDVSGIHYFDENRVRVVSLLGFDKNTNVQCALIEAYNYNTDKWVRKAEPTTFFPSSWSWSKLLAECQCAFHNRVRVSNYKYKGITQSGVQVVFIYDETDQLKTVYPICEEL